MRSVLHCLLVLLLLLLPIGCVYAQTNSSGAVWATPHDSYSSSIGVLGCKIDTDRVAYWPGSVDCSNICVSLSYEDRSVKLLRVDQSQGAYDVSYDAWNYLYTGYSATKKPTAGGPIPMNYENVDASECKDLIHTDGHKLPLSAANSMNFLTSCLDGDTWVGQNYVLFNILDSICSWGHDEECSLDWPTANQATCPSTLGAPVALTTDPVYNVKYPSGETVDASTGQVVDVDNSDDDKEGRAPARTAPSLDVLAFSLAISSGILFPFFSTSFL
ncbi:hypothetical protein F4809DRAFT_633488 [Biscogniauxia mediterranea]|nr:hypothetical protein F4809DRAFT_633488 [Biscogniauxia mediterranea]